MDKKNEPEMVGSILKLETGFFSAEGSGFVA